MAVIVETRERLAVIRMDDGKANAMNPEFFAALNRAFDEVSDAAAVILMGARSFFSGGLDLPLLAALDRASLEKLYDDLHDTMMRLFLFRAPVVAAVNGHAIAGGCILAFQADLRLMAEGSSKIGLNEIQLGLALPPFVVETFRGRLVPGALERMSAEGPLFSPREALAIGLVDEVVAPGELESRAVERARQLAAFPPAAFAESKRLLRAPAVLRIAEARRQDASRWVDLWFSSEAQRRIGDVVARLAAKKPAS